MPFIMLSAFSSIPRLLSVFIMEGCWVFCKCFFCNLVTIMWFWFLILSVDMFYYINWFYAYLSLPSWDKAQLVMVYNLFSCCWVWFASILLKICLSVFTRDIGLWSLMMSFQFLKYFVEFTSEIIYTWAFLCRYSFDYWFNLFIVIVYSYFLFPFIEIIF